MKALVKTKSGVGNIEIKDVPFPKIKDDEVLIRVAYCGLCGTDIHIHNDEFPNDPPVIIGHEFSGIVKEVGKSVKNLTIGDRVVSELHTGACRTCRLCKAGYSHICPGKRPVGSKEDGAMAEYIKLPAWLIHKIPRGVSLKVSAISEPMAIVCHSLFEQARIEDKMPEDILILGASTIGLLTTIVAGKLGIHKIIVSGTNIDVPIRLPLAKELGASVIVNSQVEDIKSIAEKFTNNEGLSAIVECSGSTAAIRSAVKLIRRRGLLVLIGLVSQSEISIPWNDILYKEIAIASSFSSTASSWERALGLLPEIKHDLERVITHTIHLEDWQNGFELMQTGKAVKVMVEIGGESVR